MRMIRLMLAGAALVMFASLSAAAAPRWGGSPQYGVYNQNNAAYQQGYNDALDDARHNRNQVSRADRYHNDADRAAYDQGYRDGRQSYANQTGVYPNQQYPNGQYPNNNGRGRGWGWGRNRGNVNNGQYGYGSQNAAQIAQRYGYQDGVNEGSNDRQTGHSFRPTHDRGYELATNGYNSSLGVSKDQYKQWYRQAYQQGYQQGYNGNRGGYGWRR